MDPNNAKISLTLCKGPRNCQNIKLALCKGPKNCPKKNRDLWKRIGAKTQKQGT